MNHPLPDTRHPSLQQVLATELAGLEAQGLKRQRRLLETPQGARVTVDGREYLAFCSNDYLGLADRKSTRLNSSH